MYIHAYVYLFVQLTYMDACVTSSVSIYTLETVPVLDVRKMTNSAAAKQRFSTTKLPGGDKASC